MKKYYLLSIFILYTFSILYANIITSNGTGRWNQATTWNLNRVPNSSDSVVIRGNDSVSYTGSIDTVRSITINANGILATNGTGSDTLYITLSVQIAGKLFVNSPFYANIGNSNDTVKINSGGLIYQGPGLYCPLSCQSIDNQGTYSFDPFCGSELIVGKRGQNSTISGKSYGDRINPINLVIVDNVDVENMDMGDSIYTLSLWIKNGGLSHASKIALINAGFSPFFLLGNGDPAASAPYLDGERPTLNDTLDVAYGYTGSDISVGLEIPQNRVIGSLSIYDGNVNNPTKVIISNGNIFAKDIYFSSAVNRKIVIQGLNSLYCEDDILNAFDTTCYIVTTGGGKLKRKVNPSLQRHVVFPVGTANSYDPVFLNFTASSAIDTFEVSVQGPPFTNDPSDTSRLVKREWNIHQNTDGGDTANIEFLYDPAVEKGEQFNINGSLVIGHYTNNAWNESGATLSGDTVISNSTFHSFSPFAFGNDHSLPIRLLSFNANRQQNGNVLLNWIIINETNNKEFDIERSIDGIHFDRIGKVAGRVNSIISNSYAFTDMQPQGNILYYRLKQIDMNGRYSHSPVVIVKIASKYAYSIYSNPVNHNLILKQNNIKEETVQATIIDAGGKMMYSNKLNMNSGYGNIDVSKLLHGKYSIQINNGSDKYITTFIKL